MTTLTAPARSHGLVGDSPQIRVTRRLIDKAARHRLPVLLLGESGSGKEVVARAIHDANPPGRFVPIDCGSLAALSWKASCSGTPKCSFRGATENQKSLVELAGTAFFDETFDLPFEMQAKLLRLVQEKEFRAVGSSLQWKRVNLRMIAATHRDLKAEVANGKFRLDLYNRLNVFPIKLAPLRERKDDIPRLIDHFLLSARESGRSTFARVRKLSPS